MSSKMHCKLFILNLSMTNLRTLTTRAHQSIPSPPIPRPPSFLIGSQTLAIRIRMHEVDVSCQATRTLTHWFRFVVKQNKNKNKKQSYTVSVVHNLINKSILASYVGWDWIISIWLWSFLPLSTAPLYVHLWRQAQQVTAGWLCSYLPPWKPAPCLGGALAWSITTLISGRPWGFSVQTGLNWSFSKKSRS